MYSKEEHINKVTSVLGLFASPDTYGLYKIALVALESDWKLLSDDSEKGKTELD